MAYRLVGVKPLFEPMLEYCQLEPKKVSEIVSVIYTFSSKKMHLKMSAAKWWQFCLGLGPQCINSLAPGRSECDSKNGIFNLVLLIGIFRSSHDNALRWMPHDLTDDKSTLVQVMAWCRQATSDYLSQCCLSPLSLYGVARPQWVKSVLGFGIKGGTWTHIEPLFVCWIFRYLSVGDVETTRF